MENMTKRALVLGGGGSRGAYEIGVWQALKEMDIKVDIVTGTSVGAINGAAVLQGDLERACAIWGNIHTSQVFDFPDLWKNGGGNYGGLRDLLEAELSEEAIRSCAVEFGIVTVEFPSMKSKYLWKEDIPKGKMLDYILASASCFPAVNGYEIGEKTYIDGAYADNLPVGMALEKGATHVIAVDLDSLGRVDNKVLERVEHLIKIQSPWDLGNFLVFDTENFRHIKRLGYLDTLKAFGAYDGKYYCFIKGQMDRRRLSGAEKAAAIFGLDPEVIYSKEVFLETLRWAIDAHKNERIDFGNLGEKGVRTLMLALAHRLKEGGATRDILLSKPATFLLDQGILAAKYLVWAGLV